ncbi:6-bladed beta-propeller, partial [Gemmatimonadota bacterium]
VNPAHSFRIHEENGITIAETIGGPKYQDPLFTFEEVLVLKEDPENEDSMLYRAGLFLRGDDGRFYVADAGNSRIAIFDKDGVYQSSFGQNGYGPGDFAGMSWIEFVNGELQAYDMMTERVSRFSLEGELLGVVSSPASIAASAGYQFRMHLTADSSPVVITQQDDYRSGEAWQRRCGFLYSEGGDSLLAVKSEWILDSIVYPVGEQFNTMILPYSLNPQVSYSPHHGFVWGTGEVPVLDRSTLEGQHSRIRFDTEPVPVTAEDRRRTRDAYDRRIAEAEGGRRAMLETVRDALRWPSHRPIWQGVEVDDQGFIWLLAYETFQEREEQGGMPLYLVLSPDGEYLGHVRIPSLGAKGFGNGYLTIVLYEPETGERMPTVFRMHPAVSGLKYPN